MSTDQHKGANIYTHAKYVGGLGGEWFLKD